jgi:glucose dehydrogenase
MATTITLVADAIVVLRASLTWSFAIAAQVVAAIALVASSPRRRVGAVRAFDLLWAASGPWTLWLAGFTWWIAGSSPRDVELHRALPTVVMPAAWTTCLVFAYCREVLSHSTRAAVVRTSLHQAAMWAVGASYFFWAVQGWPRLIGLFG